MEELVIRIDVSDLRLIVTKMRIVIILKYVIMGFARIAGTIINVPKANTVVDMDVLTTRVQMVQKVIIFVIMMD